MMSQPMSATVANGPADSEAYSPSPAQLLPSPPATTSSAHVEQQQQPTASSAEADPELLKQQLQLIQLCFAEHEFGIVVGEEGGRGSKGTAALSSDDSSASERSLSSSSDTGDGAVGTLAAASQHQKRADGRHRYPAYDPLRFVKDKVQYGVPLTVLSQDLHSYAQYLEDKIAICVNTDVHTAFVNVSGHLVGMRDELSYMERPLAAAMEKLSTAVAQLSSTSQGVKSKVEAACTAEMERTFDSVYLKGLVVYETIAYQLDDLAQLLHISVDMTAAAGATPASTSRLPAGGAGVGSYSTAGAQSSSSRNGLDQGSAGRRGGSYAIAPDTRLSDAALDVLEDVVLLFQELKEVNHRLVSLPSRKQEKTEMTVHVAAAEQSVMGVLEVVLVHVSHLAFDPAASADSASVKPGAAVAPSSSTTAVVDERASVATQMLGRVIGLYSQAGEMEQFCAVFRNAVLRPPLEAVVSWKAATQARQSAEGTVALLEQMKAVLQTKYLPLLPLLRERYGAPLHPAATIVWPILSETLVKKLPSLYEVGIPNHFQVKYKAAYGLLAVVEAACADMEELTALRQSPDVVLWNHKWNLDVYAALRVSEVDKALQSVASPLDQLPAPTSAAAECDYHLRVFYVVHQQLLHLFSPSVYLFLCTPRFLRQTVACCYRVLQRVQEAVARHAASANGAAPEGGGGGEDARSLNDTLLLAISDAHALRAFLNGQLLQVILERLTGAAGTASSASPEAENGASLAPAGAGAHTGERSTAALVTDVITFASNTICGQFVQQARATLVQQVTDASVGPLQNVKSVRSAYSHTRKTMPSAASWYVAPALQPLQRFAEEAQRCGFSGGARDESIVAMLRAIVEQFVLLAKETLITAKKTEESWEKLRRRKEGSAASPVNESGAGGGEDPPASPTATASGQRVTMETATDRDKMTIQLWMDSRALVEAVQQPPLSIPAAAAEEVFQPAFDLLRRAEWIQGADIPEPPDVDA